MSKCGILYDSFVTADGLLVLLHSTIQRLDAIFMESSGCSSKNPFIFHFQRTTLSRYTLLLYKHERVGNVTYSFTLTHPVPTRTYVECNQGQYCAAGMLAPDNTRPPAGSILASQINVFQVSMAVWTIVVVSLLLLFFLFIRRHYSKCSPGSRNISGQCGVIIAGQLSRKHLQ